MKDPMPKYIYDDVTQISVQDLKKIGVDAVGIDLDNTTVYDSTLKPFKGVKEWINGVTSSGVAMVIVSNTNHPRAYILAKMFHLPYFAMSKKPDSKNIIRAAEFTGVPIERFAMIGDQLFADVSAANSCGAVSIWVRPKWRERLFASYFKHIRDKEREFCAEHGIEYRELK